MFKTLSIFIFVLLMTGCLSDSDKVPETEATEVSPEFLQDSELYHKVAQLLVARYSRELKAALMSVMANAGTADAIRICGQKVLDIDSAYSGTAWSIRRVSEKDRNPDNRARQTELAILSRFADSAASPSVENWIETDSTTTFYYYQPIRTGTLCLKCHGDMQTLAPGVFEVLKKKYPLDKAIGYKTDELRGMFVVEAGWPDGKESALQFLTDSL